MLRVALQRDAMRQNLRVAPMRHRMRRACSSQAIPATSSQDGRAASWERTYTAKTQAELDMAYAEWSKTYDDDSLRRFGYAAPAEAARVVARHLGTKLDARILDAGAGTGLVGSFLAARGYRNLVGLDRSQPMLEQARKKGDYAELRCADLGDPTAVEPRSLAALVAVGTLTPNHGRWHARGRVEAGEWLRQWAEWLRPGGLVCLSLRSDFWQASLAHPTGVGAVCGAMAAEGRWREVEVTAEAPYTPLVSDVTYQIRTYRVAA